MSFNFFNLNLIPFQINYSTILEEQFITSRCLDPNSTNTKEYKLLYNFHLFHLFTSHVDTVVVALYNVPLAI
jgi:hypothetical protein